MGPHMAAQWEKPLKSPAATGNAKTPKKNNALSTGVMPLMYSRARKFQWTFLSIYFFVHKSKTPFFVPSRHNSPFPKG
jgi:hypothetical protein